MLRLAFGGPLGIPAFLVLALLDLAIPIWAERSGRPTPWHPEHIAERYGLFTIIVLGECVLASSSAVQLAMAAGEVSVSLLAVALGGLLLVFALWWSYFKHPAEIDRSLSLRQAVAVGLQPLLRVRGDRRARVPDSRSRSTRRMRRSRCRRPESP